MLVRIAGGKQVAGEYVPPPDKSISHRAAMLLSIAEGDSFVTNFLVSGDTEATLGCLRKAGAQLELEGNTLHVSGVGLDGFKEPEDVLDAANSATTMRLLSGLFSGYDFLTVITGDVYLRRRPMKRIIEPLSLMGATILSRSSGLPPLVIRGGKLRGINYSMKVASAQVKSAVMLAALKASGQTVISGAIASRDHTERMLHYLGADIAAGGGVLRVNPVERLTARPINVPGDLSSAAYFIAAALVCPGSKLIIRGVGLNPTRTGFIEVVKKAGANIKIVRETVENNEPLGDIQVEWSGRLEGFEVSAAEVPLLIDELPLIAVLGALSKYGAVVRGAEELRYKETDRITSTLTNLRKMGAEVEEHPDGFVVKGMQVLHEAELDSFDDHRIAMAFAVAALAVRGTTTIRNAGCVRISYPNFFDDLQSLLYS